MNREQAEKIAAYQRQRAALQKRYAIPAALLLLLATLSPVLGVSSWVRVPAIVAGIVGLVLYWWRVRCPNCGRRTMDERASPWNPRRCMYCDFPLHAPDP